MVAFEDTLTEVISELADGDYRDESIERIQESLYDVYGLWAYRQLVEAREKSDMSARSRNPTTFAEARGRSIAFSEIWQKIVFDGSTVQDGTVSPKQVKEAEKYWTDRLEKWRLTAQPARVEGGQYVR